MPKNKLFIVAILAIMAGIFAVTPTCFAEDALDPSEPLIVSNDTSTDSCEQTGFIAQENWQAGNCYTGNLFLAGNNVEDSSSAGGIGFAVGSNLSLLGNYEYGFHAGNIVNVSGSYKKDVFVAGSIVKIDSNAQIPGDIYVAGESVTISAPVQNVYVLGGSLEIDAEIQGNVYTNVGQITLSQNAKIGGTLTYGTSTTVTGLEYGNVANFKTYETSQNSNSSNNITNLLFSICSLAVISLILAFLTPKFLVRIHNKTKSDNFTAGATDVLRGIAVLIGVPLLAIILLISLLGIPAAVIIAVFYVAGLILTTPVVGYYIGCLILKNPKKDSKWNEFLRGVLGVAIIKILCVVPFIGSLVSFIVLAWGLGILWQVLISRNRQKYIDKSKD